MKWYKRLFWKVFAAIWCVSFLVLLATVCVVATMTEQDRFKEVVTARAEGYAELMIGRYERTGFRSQLPKLPRKYKEHDDDDDDHKRDDHRSRHPDRKRDSWLNIAERVYITDVELGRKVVGFQNFNPEPEELYRFVMSSESGRLYQVDLDLRWDRSPFAHLMSRILSVQLVLILLVSGLGALLVSAIIARPLKLLREHTQAIYRGELDTRTDEKLRQRGDELGELARDFDRMADYVQQTLTSHQRLMQDVSHELRAPLARLQAAAGIAEQRLGEDDKAVARIIRECQRLDQLIGEILSLSRLEQMEVSGEGIALSQFLGELLGDARFSHPQRDFSLVVHSECEVRVNEKLLERALNNILGNACKHTPPESAIELSVSCASQCEIRIRDHGPGVTEEQLSKLCDPFYRGSSQSEGYGLGLSIASRAIQRLGGKLTLANHPEGGLEVLIRVPAAVKAQ
ncbi:sensor histidine kinase [Neptuniibacter halophilus]|uniref:sensor histidine kinase n=1 Tax=Neptuniibacter halophilus TaxID=651666 RepID=UPI002573842B|nr:ATP-binding protein [Neptuniibacter halophilus]